MRLGALLRRPHAAHGDLIHLDELPASVRLKVSARARRFTLRLGQPGEGPFLTLPPGVPLAEAESFLRRHAGWLERALERQPSLIPVDFGTPLPVGGKLVEVVRAEGPRRAPALEGDRLVLGGKGAAGPRIAAWLRLRARDSMEPLVRDYARQLGRPVEAVTFRDTRSRWGSCTSRGRISLSWRLAMAPPEIQAYVAAHEVAHLSEMNHSPSYWRVLASLMPDYAGHRSWLRREGKALHAYDFRAGG